MQEVNNSIVSKTSVPICETAWLSLKQSTTKVRSGCNTIDNLFNGGLKYGVTELCGEAGVGKTQLVLQYLLHCQLPINLGGSNGSCIILNTEGQLVTNRLLQMISYYHLEFPSLKLHNFLEGILSTQIFSATQLKSCIEDDLEEIIQKQNCKARENNTHREVRLLVIDSISSLFKGELSNSCAKTSFEYRSLLMSIGLKLREIARKCNLCVVVTNHVTSTLDNEGRTIDISGNNLPYIYPPLFPTNNGFVKPALGLSWSNCLDTRLFLTKSYYPHFSNLDIEYKKETTWKREAHIVLSPSVSMRSCEFTIANKGIFGIPNSQYTYLNTEISE